MKNYIILLLITLKFSSVQAQQILTLKTTESYLIEMPSTYGNFKHEDEFMTWQINFNNKKITYFSGNLKKTFNFSYTEKNEKSTKDRGIYNYENPNESLTLITGTDNYLKIKIYSDRVPNSNPTSYNSVKVFTNYSIDNFNELLVD